MTRSTSRRRVAVSLGAAAIVLALAACSGSAANGGAPVPPGEVFGPGTAGPEPAASAPSDQSGGGDGSVASSPPRDLALTTDPNTYIVRTGSISIEVPKVDPALLQVRTAILALGGYVSDSDQSNDVNSAMASVTYRIPVARWQDALDAITGIAAKVDSAKSNATEVTGQVLDLGARIDNLKTTELALQAIMARATKISDVLAVESQLSDVQGQIEQLSTQQAHLKDSASLATLTVLFALPPTPETIQTSRGWDPGAQLDEASSALLGIGQALASAGIWLVVVGLPVGLAILIVLALAFFLARRIRRSGPPAQVIVPPTEG
ncbi:MAG TPA: DUF4349 domain-containing protein [Candidatus Limnocylindrales bacterium]